jgi:hypothetical protein
VLADWYEQGEYLRYDGQGFLRQPLEEILNKGAHPLVTP